MRDQAQHWMIVISEDALYINSRALITTIDEVLQGHFEDTLADHYHYAFCRCLLDPFSILMFSSTVSMSRSENSWRRGAVLVMKHEVALALY